jgi:hypothetical protein
MIDQQKKINNSSGFSLQFDFWLIGVLLLWFCLLRHVSKSHYCSILRIRIFLNCSFSITKFRQFLYIEMPEKMPSIKIMASKCLKKLLKLWHVIKTAKKIFFKSFFFTFANMLIFRKLIVRIIPHRLWKGLVVSL